MSMTIDVKNAMMSALGELPPTSNGTEIQAVVGSGQDAFDKYQLFVSCQVALNATCRLKQTIAIIK